VVAYRNATRLLGETAARQVSLGEAIASAAGGMVTTEAQDAFERALELEPGNPRAQYLIATGYMQEGRTEDAAAVLRAMRDGLPEGSPWTPVIEQALASIAPDAPGPSPEDVEAASNLSDDERAGMIEAMVAGLDQRLRENPADPEGWQRLVQSYLVMNRPDAASDALVRGVEALGPASEEARQLLAFAASRGVEATE
jgi:cytochrome c-type biogenesis protein CcmH